jgi:ATP-dependent DNA ligase
MEYNSFKYIYPPRPEYKIMPDELHRFGDEWIAQPKYNGDCVMIYTNGQEFHVYNRRGEKYTKKFNVDIFYLSFLQGKWYCFVGEYLNPKLKKGENGNLLTDRVVLFDVLVANSKYLLGYPLWERLKILNVIFEPYNMSVLKNGELDNSEFMLKTDVPDFYVASSFVSNGNLEELFEQVIKVDAYEGLVVKNSNASLQPSFNEKNNELWQFKCRKPTKVYNF